MIHGTSQEKCRNYVTSILVVWICAYSQTYIPNPHYSMYDMFCSKFEISVYVTRLL